MLQLQDEIGSIEKQIMKLKTDLSKYGDYSSFVYKKENLQVQLDNFRLKKAEAEASKKGYEAEIARCERDLGINSFCLFFYFLFFQ